MVGKREITVGAFVLGAVILLLVGLSYLRQRPLFSRTIVYHVIYDNVEGLTAGDKVLVNGYTVGQVMELKFDPKTAKIAVYFDVNNQVIVPKDSKAVVASFDFFGSKCIRLILGKSADLAENGDELNGNIEKGMIEEVKDELIPVKNKIEKVVEDIQVITSSLKKHFNDTTGKVNNIVHNMDVATTNVAGITSDVRGSVHRINNLTDSLNGLVGMLKSYDPQVKTIMKNTGEFSNALNASTSDLQQLIRNTKNSTDELKNLVSKINSGEGTMGQLMNDKKLYNNLNSASQNLDSLLLDLRLHPKRYVQFSIIGRKEKQK